MDTTTENPDKGLGVLTSIGQIFVGFLLPLIMFLVNKGNPAKQWITDVAKEALNFQITMIIAYIALIIVNIIIGIIASAANLGFLGIISLLLMLAWFAAWVILPIMATIAVNNGRVYQYPYAIRLIK